MTRAIRILNYSSQNITVVVTAVAPPPEDVEEERELHADLSLLVFAGVILCLVFLGLLWVNRCAAGPRISPSSLSTSSSQGRT
ncbi:hypothetical protein P8452_02382 [Trifolium repens]|nr:hypothetical protein P8452_02382 [Trifolium repens]